MINEKTTPMEQQIDISESTTEVRPMTLSKEVVEKFTSRTYLALFPVLVVGAAYLVFPFAFHDLEFNLYYRSALLGAAGWYVALILRLPFIALLKQVQLSDQAMQIAVVLLSGPCEEGTRVAVVALQQHFNQEFPSSNLFNMLYNTGAGWAAIECLFVVVQGIAMTKLVRDTSDKAKEAMQKFEEIQGRKITDTDPLWGIVERVWASGIHVGFTLMLGYSRYLALPLALVHSLTNLAVLYLVRRYGAVVAELGFGLPIFVLFIVAATVTASDFAGTGHTL